MTIWILALLLFGCLAAVGYQQGAIRVAISFIGIIVAALLAGPLAKFAKPVVTAVGVVNPVLVWIIPPFVVYFVILAVFKIIAFVVHRKVDVHYKYKAGDLRLALWERLNARLGMCLGLLNALAYLVLISMVIYPFNYWTVQLASPDGDSRIIKLFNQVGRDLQNTGMARVARALDPMPTVFYKAADLAGLIHQNQQNQQFEERLKRYPTFLMVTDKPEFEVIKNPNVKAIMHNPDLLKTIWGIVSPDLNDLITFLKQGKSAKYTEQILGRWYFDLNRAMADYRQSKPNIPSSEMEKIKIAIANAYAKTSMMAAPDHQVVLKNYPKVKQQPGQPPSMAFQTLQGHWKGTDGEYELSFGSGDVRKAKVEAGRLYVTGEGFGMVFTPED
jgi:hypothetical protein